jgi:pimeloyl-ACP methyl ester carboxylesterase
MILDAVVTVMAVEPVPAAARHRKEHIVKSAYITGGGGTRIHVVETGNPQGRPILFIHGLSSCWLTWSRQLNSDLAQDYRLVAMDLRGHGLSDKPRDAYSDSKLWADDVNAVIQTLGLERPILSGWSYGPLVILDYVRHYGEDAIGGIQIIGGITKLGSEDALAVLTPEFLGLVPDLLSTDAEESVRGLASLVQLFFVHAPSPEDLYLILGYNVSVPPYVRQGLFSRSLDNDDLLPTIRKPVLITHGTEEAIVKPSAVDQHRAGIPHAQVQMIPHAGHATFWEDASAFNEGLKSFAASM